LLKIDGDDMKMKKMRRKLKVFQLKLT